jgi:hypothetical protein
MAGSESSWLSDIRWQSVRRWSALLLAVVVVLSGWVSVPVRAVADGVGTVLPSQVVAANVYESFVNASYEDFLGRLPAAAEVAFQSNALMTGVVSRADYLASLSRSDEWLSAIVTKMYLDTLSRTPDAGGLSGWVSWLREGRFTVAETASRFYASDEYFAVAAAGSTSAWVTLLYQRLLNRDPDSAGLPFWIANTDKYGRDWVAYNFYQSEESRLRRVENIYQALLYREPDAVGWPFWAARVLSTGDLQLAWEVANSEEYWQRAQVRFVPTYLPPTIGNVSPSSGATQGGVLVTITGAKLATVTSVMFGGVAGSTVTPVSQTVVTVLTPAHAAGAVNVTVMTLGGPATSVGGFTYLGLGPDSAALQLTHDFAAPGVADSRNTLNGISVRASGTMDGYARTLFPTWLDATAWGWPPVPNSYCDVRQAALYREGTNVGYSSTCSILSGAWLDAYTGTMLYATSDVDIDHIVPLAEAWRSGAAAWTDAQRRQYANNKLVVLAVDDGTNASKGDKTPDLWKPPNQSAHCLYAKRWIAIKATFGLSVNTAEKTALNQMLDSCPN